MESRSRWPHPAGTKRHLITPEAISSAQSASKPHEILDRLLALPTDQLVALLQATEPHSHSLRSWLVSVIGNPEGTTKPLTLLATLGPTKLLSQLGGRSLTALALMSGWTLDQIERRAGFKIASLLRSIAIEACSLGPRRRGSAGK